MSNYPIWWNTTVTIYNRFQDPQTALITWYRYVVNGCFWKYIGEKVTVGNTIIETKDIVCRIPKNDAFLEQYLWRDVPNDKMSNYFTLGKDDIIVKGEVDEEIDEYKSGKRSSDFLSKYKKLQGCLQIQEFAMNIDGGRNNEHYYVKGI